MNYEKEDIPGHRPNSQIFGDNKKPEDTNKNNEENNIIIPPQYQGLDSETLEFLWSVPEYVDPEKTKSEKGRKQKVIDFLKKQELQEKDDIVKQKNQLTDEAKLEETRQKIILNPEESADRKSDNVNSMEQLDEPELNLLVRDITKGRRQEVVDLYNKWLNDLNNPGSKKALIQGLFNDIYSRYRIAEYPTSEDEEKIWEFNLDNKRVPVNNEKSEWMYRGIFPSKGESTITRGSFNVHITQELINNLDQMILDGKIKANYKFGAPNSATSPSERHDSISIYFLEQPSNEMIKELADLVKPYVRGDNLLGKKVSDGFFMSEIGSIEVRHIELLIDEISHRDPIFANAIKGYTSPRPGKEKSLKMSEAQFYAIKDVAKVFGYSLDYDQNGFKIN